MERKLSRSQIEKLFHAMDMVAEVRNEIEETGKNKRISNALDKIVGLLYDIVYR